MHGAKNFPFIFLTLLAGCTEQPPELPRFADRDPIVETQTPVVEQQGIGPQLYKVIKIIDGDTIDVLTDDKETIRLRFNGIDTPERGQPFGNNATDFVKDMVGGKMVSIIETDEPDRYGRLIADVYHDGKLINLELVRAGLAWHYVEYAPDDKALAAAELEAREQNAGLWAGSHKVIAPWDWRKLSKVERDKLR